MVVKSYAGHWHLTLALFRMPQHWLLTVATCWHTQASSSGPETDFWLWVDTQLAVVYREPFLIHVGWMKFVLEKN